MLELNFSQTLGNHCLTINETLPANGITAIFGVSGAGKTSLINAISGLTRPQKGRIVLNGRVLNDADKGICLTPEKRRVGYVFQDARLFPHYKVRGNLRYGMAKSMVNQFDKLVALLGIEPLLDRLPGSLSGGEKQRVAIGRALLTAPELLLLDEPLQAALRIRIQASDVSLVLQPPQQTSIRNVLRAKVVNSYDDNGQVEVELEVGCKTLWARISPWARDELAIKPGLWLYAQIKSVSITA
ncbi:TPA: ATP-binding cassette domain-containing protein [Escherichia coli]|nr:ATP-binding cassette domain-containing protein [Escherichia coli]